MDLELYLDNAATTPILPEVAQDASDFLGARFGNPSALHRMGTDTRKAVGQAREKLARLLDVPPKGIIFTSGGSEADNLALKGVFDSTLLKGNRLLISALEHPAVSQTADYLALKGVQVEQIPLTPEGVVDLKTLETMLDTEVRMVSVMTVSNELGTVQPLEQIGQLLKKKAPKTIFHTDAVQAFTKMPLNLKKAGVHLASISAHKHHGPKGIGALVMARHVPLVPLIHGGGQENNLRSGTENPFAIWAFAQAAHKTTAQHTEQNKQRAAYHQNWLDFLNQFPALKVFTSPAQSPYIIHFSYPTIPGEVVLHHLEAQSLMVSTGSACSTRKAEPSPGLLALGMEPKEALSSVRLSFSLHNTLPGQQKAFQAFSKAMEKLAKI